MDLLIAVIILGTDLGGEKVGLTKFTTNARQLRLETRRASSNMSEIDTYMHPSEKLQRCPPLR